ncbi:MAG: Nif3-like dinuclear metal center hexameric protein [Phycisphaerales bacterium]|nr:Nif3-like dinuclear metal center hexameric protein [Phycisphaerales bacterium]
MRIADLLAAMDTIAPLRLAAEWDNVGLLVGTAGRDLRGPVVLTIDLTEPVVAEAAAAGAGAIVAYHPPIFKPVRRLTDGSPRERALLRAAESGIAIYSPHTALDAASGGLTDWLCEGVSGGSEGKIAGDCRALSAQVERDEHQQVKIVTFVPEAALEEVRSALATAGAGIIGNYRVCSFTTPGTGTFLGAGDSQPVVGERGRLERVPEHRLEMVCSRAGVAIAVETLRRFHPYEQAAIDVYTLEGLPRRSVGPGRRVVLDRPVTVSELAKRLKKHLGISMVKVARSSAVTGAAGPDPAVTHVGVCAGSGAHLAVTARLDGCEAYITGEMTHHEVMAELDAGMSVLLAGHTNTERGYLPRLARRLLAELPGAEVVVSTADKSPFVPE